MSRSCFLPLLLASAAASGYEGQVRRQSVDGGTHQPVLTRAPELILSVPAAYPQGAAASGLTADVRLLITIDANGLVSNARVDKAVGHGFDEAALEAVKQFQFSPGEVDGSPAAVQVEYLYHFTLTPPTAPEPSTAPAGREVLLRGQVLATGSRSRIDSASIRCMNLDEAPEVVSNAKGDSSWRCPRPSFATSESWPMATGCSKRARC